ncbi:unnamed protein product [Fraxinus pennsylvanica]|uniref:MPBQ/MBSQ family SAM-binding methyltransferase profile domain-containing protein n=1 Tax=Fraxinus pennsylvanica TaxID=56036 RepID=A0AAD1ZQ90_9LAMI|nr:unnamed protein product [Fraxinus pennsylvanica]
MRTRIKRQCLWRKVAGNPKPSEIWDCETIVSTYSNLDNHPAKIVAPGGRRKKKLTETISGAQSVVSQMIVLKGREKLPVGFLPQREMHGVEKVKANKDPNNSRTEQQKRKPRSLENKDEMKERFLSIVYDHVINPGHWTEDMRDDALEPADSYSRNLTVVDVGGGTGFTTLGIVKHVDAKNVTILDQSPHQLAKAKKKEPLKECKIIEGDAEDLPFPTDYADRYISAGSIEYWPDPQRGIKEAYRVLKLGGKACLIGPVYPTFWLSRFFADMWMLFQRKKSILNGFKRLALQMCETGIRRLSTAAGHLLCWTNLDKEAEDIESPQAAADVIRRCKEYAKKYENENPDQEVVLVEESSGESETIRNMGL